MFFLRQSTASQAVVIGPFVDSTDGDTAETGLTIANTDIKLSKNGGALGNKNSGGGTHDADGWYTATLDATDTNTVGRLQLKVHVAGALAVWMEFQVVEEAVYDALFASSADIGTTVWATAARTLTAIDEDNTTLDLDATIRGAVGLASADLDTQLAALPTANENADALLDRSAGVETNRTPRQSLRLMLAALCGKASGLATTTAVYRDTNDSTDRITATVDADGNRTSVTLDAS